MGTHNQAGTATQRLLGGEAVPGSISTRDEAGNEVDPSFAICPILQLGNEGQWKAIGTGFFISTNGVFATAKHVFEEKVDDSGRYSAGMAVTHFMPRGGYRIRPILRVEAHAQADVAVGVIAPMRHKQTGEILRSKMLTLARSEPSVGDRISTYAYPKTEHVVRPDKAEIHFFPNFYDGRIEEFYPTGRDRVMLPAPCYRTSMALHGGSSGGPVFGPHGKVVGINSSSFSFAPNDSFISRIEDILQLPVHGVEVADRPESMFTVDQLAAMGWISFD